MTALLVGLVVYYYELFYSNRNGIFLVITDEADISNNLLISLIDSYYLIK